MPEIRGSVDILRPVEDVFAFLSEPENSLQWETGVVEMKKTTEGPLAVGSKGRRVEKQMGTDEGTWEITEHVPNETLAMTFESQRFTGSGGYKLEAIDGGTRLNYWFNGVPRKILFKLLMPLMMPMIHRQIRKNYAKLKGILEP
jgi:hypothetical protein